MKILVWPGFSVVGLEIAEQLRFMKGVTLYSGSSEIAHPMAEIFTGLIEIPNLKTSNFLLDQQIVDEYIIFPAHDYVLDYISNDLRNLKWVGSNRDTIRLSRDKSAMYRFLGENLSEYCPQIYQSVNEAEAHLPCYLKPNAGYGSQDHRVIENILDLKGAKELTKDNLLMEILQGEEFTVECLSTKDGKLVYSRGRKRLRVRMGTSLSFESPQKSVKEELEKIALLINENLKLDGPWYFQVKARNMNKSDFKILEISTRLPGSSVWSRANGINLAELAVWNFRNEKIQALGNSHKVEVERILSSKMSLKFDFEHIYIDLDDTILVDNKPNPWAVAFMIQERNRGKKIHLLTKSLSINLASTLIDNQLEGFFDTVIHLDEIDSKSNYISSKSSIFIDDSFSERQSVQSIHGIPCYGPEVFQLLVK
jgi:hypothetical protein